MNEQDLLKKGKVLAMTNLDSEAKKLVPEMTPEEREQHQIIDKKFHNLENYAFETQLRELVEQCIKPVRNM